MINVKTRWKEYSRYAVDTDEYRAVEHAGAGSRPKELFEYLIEDIEGEYEAAKVRKREPRGDRLQLDPPPFSLV